MDYFLIRQSGTISIPKAPGTESPASKEPSVRIMDDPASLDKFDYLAVEHLVSDRFRQLLSQYLPEQLWRPCFFVNPKKAGQKTFWFLPSLPYLPKKVVTASSGMPAAIYIEESDFASKAPGILLIRSPKRNACMIVHLSVAESMLRRGICGLELARLE